MIELHNIRIRYGTAAPILDNVSILIKPGSFHFLTGPSGSGKTSLLRLLTLSVPPAAGRLKIFGISCTRASVQTKTLVRRRLGVVHQDTPMLDYLTVFDNVALPLHIVGKKAADYREDVVDLLQWVGLGDRIDALPPTLSGGEKQRAAIARAVIGRPELILADEPTANVEPPLARRLLRLFVEMNKLGSSVIICTHDHWLMQQFRAPRLEISDCSIHEVEPK